MLSGQIREDQNTDISQKAGDIESRLLNWNGATEYRPSCGDNWEAGFEAYRIAALIYLYMVPMRLRRTDSRVQSVVAAACRLLGGLGEGSEVEKPLIWVYFLVGSGAQTDEHRQFVIRRMEIASAISGLGAWDGALKVVRGMWETGDTLWNTLMIAEQHGVSFLFV